jgi:large subunit ribosomal protein L18e
MKRIQERTDIKAWLALLSSGSTKEEKAFRERVGKIVSRPKRSRRSVNLYKLDKVSKEGESIIVPGKVLSEGRLTHKVRITALDYSDAAKRALEESGSKIVGLEEMLKEKPKGGIRIVL